MLDKLARSDYPPESRQYLDELHQSLHAVNYQMQRSRELIAEARQLFELIDNQLASPLIGGQ